MVKMRAVTRDMGRAFTLVELLVVIGIMGMLATVSIGGYAALTRGMSERGALDAAAGIAEAALQRAQIDRTKTYLFLFNEVTRIDSDDQVGIVCGVAIAVRPTGRFTRVAGGELYDEFGDLNLSYNALDEEGESESEGEQQASAAAMRIYNLRTKDVATVREGVYIGRVTEPDLEENGGTGRDVAAYGFRRIDGATFQVGDEYGQEFAVMRLPPGYTFSSSVQMGATTDLGLKRVGSVEIINPTDSAAPSLTVYSRRPDGSFQPVGQTSQAKDLKRR